VPSAPDNVGTYMIVDYKDYTFRYPSTLPSNSLSKQMFLVTIARLDTYTQTY
jgi:hypothetical protein